MLCAWILFTTACSAQVYRVDTCERLYFGTARKEAPPVTDDEWQRFVDEEIAPRFPDGFTVADAQGQWRTREGVIQRERTHMLFVIHRNGTGEAELAAIIKAWKTKFAQEAVLRTREQCSVAFQ